MRGESALKALMYLSVAIVVFEYLLIPLAPLILLSAALAFFISYSIGFDAGKMWVYRNVEPWEGCE